MKIFCLVLAVCLLMISCTRMVYVVRHAEAQPKTQKEDPSLSDAGQVRAQVLKNQLEKKNIRHIYSSRTTRATLTATPLSQATHTTIEYYSNLDSLVDLLRLVKGNVLIVGHSNTVDEIVNKLCERAELVKDLSDTEYDNLFVIKLKGSRAILTRRKYGYPSNPEPAK